MNGLQAANHQFRRVLGENSAHWRVLNRWCSTAFLVAGGLLLIATVLSALEVFTTLSPEGTLTGPIFFIGLIVSYVGLLGVYPKVADQSPRLALAGVVLVGLPAIMLIVLVVWGVSGHALQQVPVPPAVIPAFGMVLIVVILLFGLGIAVIGVASLRSPPVSQTIGFLLLILAATWFGLLSATSVYGSTFPPWLDFTATGIMAVTLLAVGFRIQIGSATCEDDEGTDSRPTERGRST